MSNLLGNKYALSFKLLTSSIPLFDAASISITSIAEAFIISLQLSHFPQGSPFCKSEQLIALAKILAADVLPAPFGPENKKD